MLSNTKDLRQTNLYQEVQSLCHTFRQPGAGTITDAAELQTSPDGSRAVFTATIIDKLDGTLPTSIAQIDLSSGNTQILTNGSNRDRLPKYAPDGKQIAFLSDRHKAGDFQLYRLNPNTNEVIATPTVTGWVEYFHWSPNGQQILLGVAGHGADVSGGQGAVTSKQSANDIPEWMPEVDTGDESFRWRRAWVYCVNTNTVRPIDNPDINIWEAVWCGNQAIAAVVSNGPSEGLWYSATLHIIDINTGQAREVYSPQHQLGMPVSSPSGKTTAVIEAVCSDRWIVAGELLIIDTASGDLSRIDTHGIDMTCTEWQSETRLLLAGHRGFETVIALYDTQTKTLTENWASQQLSTPGRYATVAGLDEQGDCALITESFTQAPAIGVIRQGRYQEVCSFDQGYKDYASAIHSVDALTWQAPDGLDIQGWLLRPAGDGPHPLVMHVHGGPVWLWHPEWLGRGSRGLVTLTLLKQGYAVLLPNPRGSSGRGQDFIQQVQGVPGGADCQDLLSGLDYLVAEGIADPKRLGVTGGSYGGFMSSWLITQDPRFAAAVPVAPHTNQVTEHLLSNIPHFVALFYGGKYNDPESHYFNRSPIMFAHKAKTPTLNICGALDRCTPPTEAMQFHNALLENDVKSVLVTYPEEGHGVAKFPTVFDYVTRVVDWFQGHMASDKSDNN